MAAPRAYWKGHLKFSLISIPVKLYSATSSTAKVSLNQIHEKTKQRIKLKTFAGDEEVPRSEIIKGYEHEKGKYVLLDNADLEKIAIETSKVIEIIQFFEADELDDLFVNSPYYVGPDGPIAEEAYCVFRDAMHEAGRMALGRVTLSGKEHVVAIRTQESGFVLTTLRYAAEVRDAAPYFEDVADKQATDAEIGLAQQLVKQMTRPLDLDQYTDRYQDALLAMIKAKLDGSEPEAVQEAEVAENYSFMDALRQSVDAAAGAEEEAPAKVKAEKPKATRKKPPARSVRTKAAKKKKRA